MEEIDSAEPHDSRAWRLGPCAKGKLKRVLRKMSERNQCVRGANISLAASFLRRNCFESSVVPSLT